MGWRRCRRIGERSKGFLSRHHSPTSFTAGRNFLAATLCLRQLDVHAYLLTERFVHECAGNQQFRGRFNLNRAHTLLNDSWNAERLLLGDGADYWRSLDGRGLGGEVHPTEHNWVDYDSLGHIVLCVLKDIPDWREYALANHSDDVQRIAACGSWAAREILGTAQDAQLPRLPDTESAKRFFDGDVALFTALRDAYWNRKPKT